MPSVLDEIPYSEFVANGVSTVFGYTFTVLIATDLVVYDNGAVVPSSSYSVSGIGVEGGGAVTFLVAPLNGHLILLSRELALERDTDYQYNGPFREEVVDNDFNRLWQVVQWLRAKIGGALRAPYPEQFAELPNAANRANKVLAFDASGAPLLSIPISGSAASLAIQLADILLQTNGDAMLGHGAITSVINGVLSRHATLEAAVLAIGITRAQILVRGPTAVTLNLTIPSHISLRVTDQGLITVSNGVVLAIASQVKAGNYQIFATTGLVISVGDRNPMWWGAVPSRTSPGAAVSAANTLAFRKCALSFYSEYVQNAGTIASPGICYPYRVTIPEGMFFLSNGFAAPVGAPVVGMGANTCLCRLLANVDSDTTIPLLTVGQSLAAAPGLAYQNDPGTTQSTSTFVASGASQTAAAAWNLYFIDQSNLAAAFAPRYPGCLAHNLFFTSCGIALDLNNTGDLTIANCVIDQGLTGIILSNCQNLRLTNIILYFQQATAISVGTNVFDTSIEANIEYPQGVAVAVGGGGVVRGLKLPNLTILYNGVTGTNSIVVSANDVDMLISNLKVNNNNATALQVMSGLTNVAVKVDGYILDQTRTNPVYNQNASMQGFSLGSGRITLNNGVMRNLGARSAVSSATILKVDGLNYDNMSAALAVFDSTGSTGGSQAIFSNVTGDGITPLNYLAGGLAEMRTFSCHKCFGQPTASGGGAWEWDIMLPSVGQFRVTVTGNTDGTASLLKTATYLIEKSTEALPAITSTLTAVKLLASPIANGHPELAPTVVFAAGGGVTQAGGGVATGKVRVPNTYAQASLTLTVDYLN